MSQRKISESVPGSQSLDAWRQALEQGPARMSEMLAEIYGDDPKLIEDRRRTYQQMLAAFAEVYGGDRRVLVCRAPARINLMGVHVEHRRGEVNYVTHRRELLMVAEGRDDDQVILHNVDSDRFPIRSFRISEELQRGPGTGWMDYIESPGVTKAVAEARGDWANYVKAAVLRLQHRFPEKNLGGMNLMVAGDVPTCAGLSSSSALLVAAAFAALRLNDLAVAPEELVELCGEGEWYVGTRGGAGDHAAMIFGRRGYIAHLRFFPFELLEYVPLPDGYQVVICNSLKEARKSGAQLSEYNETIAAYNVVLMLVEDLLVKAMGFDGSLVEAKLHHLGDINLNRDLFPDSLIYRLLKYMPRLITREELLSRLPEHRKELEKIFSTHDKPRQGYRARAVAMFGLSEIARGAGCVDVLKQGDLEGFGKLMYISHDGDRVVIWDAEGQTTPWDNEMSQVTDDYLDRLIQDLASGDPCRAKAAQRMFQPGGYRCSSEELDQIVDTAKRVEGVVGAGLTGAGFGGCVLAVVKDDSVDNLLQALKEQYYDPRDLPFGAEVCVPVAGAGIVEI